LCAVAALAVSILALAGCGDSGATRSPVRKGASRAIAAAPTRPTPRAAQRPSGPTPRVAQRPSGPTLPPFAVGERVLTFVDPTRLVRFGSGAPQPRMLVTLVRYPAQGPASGVDLRGAPADRAAGPFPLVVFGHGFAVTPGTYAPLMQAWARDGYVVAAPVFPLENANAPGGPDESDLVNQPRDMSVVITRMLSGSADPRSAFAGVIDRREIAVAGQSDGGETALAVAYDSHFLDRRVRAAVILSGAKIPGIGGFDFPAPSPPLLATQGTADTINPPSLTSAFFDVAPPPKYLLTLFGASHLGPYTDAQPQLRIVERVTIAFLDRYLKDLPGATRRLLTAGDVAGESAIDPYP
jgi:dienelactone hydrolase